MNRLQNVENVPHNAAAQNDTMEPPDLPDGWRSAELVDWKDPYLAANRRARARRVALVVIVVALVIGVLLWIAATHYARGVSALEDHAYSTAVSEFSVARVLVFPYRDARSLEEQARRALQAEDARYEQAEARRAAVVAQLEKAGARLEAGDADGVRTTLQAINADELRAALNRSDSAQESYDALALDLAAAARRALGNAAWGRAGSFAAALLVLEPSSELAVALGSRARTGAELRTKLGEAKDAAHRGKWRAALRLALAVVAIRKDFPGAAAVVADARDALAPKPKPVATQPTPAATTAVSPPQAGGGSATTTPPQPPPP
ncbi:MAG: hypothetical protein NTW58_05475 [Actinobacteria bacterium]|nr:hypothetical protein [Actinomycetota bacterium]